MRRSGARSCPLVDPEEYRRWRPTGSMPHRAPSPTPSSEGAPDDPSFASTPHQQQDAGYKRGGRPRPPPPEEDTGDPPVEEEVEPPLGPSPSPEESPTRDKPFVLLGCVIDAFDLADNIIDFSTYAYGRGSLTARPVRDFVDELIPFGVALRFLVYGEELCDELRGCDEVVRSRPGAWEEAASHRRHTNHYIASIQHLIAICQAAMPRAYRESGGFISYGACLRFMHALFDDLQLFNRLIRGMRGWRVSFDAYCAPHIRWMRDFGQRIMEDEQRRTEAERRRKEHARRRERRHGRNHH